MFDLKAYAADLWANDHKGFAYYVAGYMNSKLDYSLPAEATGGIVEGDDEFPDGDTSQWKYLTARPCWRVDQFDGAKFTSLLEVFNVALGRWFMRDVRLKCDPIHELKNVERLAYEAPASIFGAASTLAGMDIPRNWPEFHDDEEPENRIFNDHEAIIVTDSVGFFAIEDVRVGSVPGTELPMRPEYVLREGVTYLDMPITMRYRLSITEPERLFWLTKE